MKASMKWPVVAAAIGSVVLIAIYLWASFSSKPVTLVEVPVAGGTYVEGLVGQPKYLNPILSPAGSVDQDIVSLVFDGLTKVSDDGTIIPALAETWDISPDGKTYTFNLRAGAKWHDGWPVVADDVVYTVRAIQDPSYKGNPAFAQLWKGVVVEKMSDSRVKFVLKDAYAPFLEFTTLGLLPSHVLGTTAAERLPESTFNLRPVGTGAFRVAQSSLRGVELESYAEYYGSKPMLDRIRFLFYPDDRSALRALRMEEIQGLGYFGSQSLEQLGDGKPRNIYAVPDFSKLTLLILNTKSTVFQDVVVRQAVALGLNREKVIDVATGGAATPASSVIIPGTWAASGGHPAYTHDPERARALLEGAGWRDADGDGIREKAQDQLKFVLLTNDRPQRVAAAQEISRQLEQVGIKVDVQAVGWSGFVQDFLVPRSFHAVLAEQWSPQADPDGYQFWHSSQAKDGLNFSRWTSRAADELLENGRKTTQPEERAKHYAEFEKLFAAEMPGIPLYYPLYTYVVDQSVKGIHPGLMIDSSHRFDHINEWYIRTKKVAVDESGKPVEK